MEWYLPVIWAGLIGTAVALYVILDGFDLGVAMLFPFTTSEAERHQMTKSIAQFWDGNETIRQLWREDRRWQPTWDAARREQALRGWLRAVKRRAEGD